MNDFILLKIPEDSSNFNINDEGALQFLQKNKKEYTILTPEQNNVYLQKDFHQIMGMAFYENQKILVIKESFSKTDEELIQIYDQGFEDELLSKPEMYQPDPIGLRAYKLGRAHAIMGDDVTSADEQIEQEILNKIKRKI